MGELKEGPTPATRAFDLWAAEVDRMVGVKPPVEKEPAKPLEFEELDILDRIDVLTVVGAQAVIETVDA